MTFDSLVNEGEYFPSFYLDEILPKQLRSGPLKEWTAKERQGEATPRQGLRDLAGPYFDVRMALSPDAEKFGQIADAQAVAAYESAAAALKSLGTDEEPPAFQPLTAEATAYDDSPEGEWRTGLTAWHTGVLKALGFDPAPGHLTVHTPTGPVTVPVAHSEPGIAVLTGGFATELDAVRADGHAGRLPAPVRVASGKTLTTVTDLAAWLLTADDAPRYALLLFGPIVILADHEFARGRYLAVNLDTALPRKAEKGASANEIDLIAAVFGAPSLRPGADGADDEITKLVTESRDHSVGVTAELRSGLQKSVQLIANEVLNRAREQGVRPDDLPEWLPQDLKERDSLPKLLTTESLRYLYRILFLLYAEARPELDILPMKSEEYATGYSIARLRELVIAEKLGSTSRKGRHFHESLALLFDKVYTGHPTADTVTDRSAVGRSAAEPPQETDTAPQTKDDGYEGVRIEALRSTLFDPKSTRLVGQLIDYPDAQRPDGTPAPPPLDLRLRNDVLHQVLRHLTLKEGKAGGRGGFISYANLSINHLGAVYEGLMSYTGFIADEALYEVAKGGDPEGGSWLITASQVDSGRYPDGPDGSVFVKTGRNSESGEPETVPYPVGSYVYRLAGRDRQTSASYYTPESLTQATVEQALRFRLDDEGGVDPQSPEKAWVNAADVLRWRVCEPALGSGAFLNEAVNQLAELYLKLAQRERGVEIDPEDYQRELQKTKAYIALHNAYGVDLNDTAVELAEISLWLNTMYPGMKAPWYGLHLHRGNSLIGAVRKVYAGQSLSDGGWLNAKDQKPPRHVPLGQPIPSGSESNSVHQSVHQFLLPALGWGSVCEDVSVRKPKKGAEDQSPVSVVAGSVAEWLEPELIEVMKRWRSVMRRKPKGGEKAAARKAAAKKAAAAAEKTPARVVNLPVEEPSGQGAFDLCLEIWDQPSLEADSGAAAAAAAPEPKLTAKQEEKRQEKQLQTQTGRLRELAKRVEYLWELVILRLRLSEEEIARSVDVWGASLPEGTRPAMDREAVVAALHAMGSPYWRLKQVMDAWCALWFWPLEEVGLLDGSDREAYFNGDEDLTLLKRGFDDERRKVALKSLDDWLEFAEAVLGRADLSRASLMEIPEVRDLPELDDVERQLDEQMVEFKAWKDALDLGDVFGWFDRMQEISEERGFFHWELDFAHVFADGGFDLMVGNPPWVRQEWDENAVLAEVEPWFVLGGKAAEVGRDERVSQVLSVPRHRSFYLSELATVAGVSSYLSSADTYPELVGTRPDMYRAFMLLAWRATGERGIAGIIHPSTHLTGAKEGVLRKAAYQHLRLHADFVNAKLLFAPPVSDTTHFSVNVYGRSREIRFQHLSWIFYPSVLSQSVRHNGAGDSPGIKHKGTWDPRPHRDRVVTVTRSTLSDWQKLAGEDNAFPIEEAKLLFPVTVAEETAIAALAKWPHRVGELGPRITPGFNEKTDRTAGYFTWDSGPAESWNDVILQGPFFGIATPFAKRPVEGARTSLQMEPWNLAELPEGEVPRTNYRRSPECSLVNYNSAVSRHSWIDPELVRNLHADERIEEQLAPSGTPEYESLLAGLATRPYARFTRMVWRRQIASNTERSLFAALMPPGPAHIHMVHSMALGSERETALTAGFWAALPLDYFLRATGRSDLQVREAQTMPAPTPGHPLEAALLLRTLRLNCQTNAYARLWTSLHDPVWAEDQWAAATEWPSGIVSITDSVTRAWTRDTPLRAEFTRRAALVEIDALVAVWLGISADELVAMYQARFPVLQQYEENMWFDATGRRITKAHQVHGYGQPKDAWKKLSSHENFPLEANVPDGYTGPLYRANRKEEMRAAHAEFTRRMREAGWEPGDTEPPEK
ncbi:Eco57I restriction-modification methylase domain-containing protein [Streptomyces cavernicola]|uniref:site-specific DNA-methyltransferase (adenine-specific) n=1 Tax=Streptomyces cavernicola TaxID=3043613 RepID=A0ABT6S2V1_9ACTN|nr:DNA methyltransferase [Streptomyces sp. B-S-A6]MDI3402373.1 class I SAM-dependent DNA methyltransferase [Streptomyces sp. B-S-A6]